LGRFIINDAFESDSLRTPPLLLQQRVMPLQLLDESTKAEQSNPSDELGEQQYGLELELQEI
jgi:hypothetical protein